VPDRSTAPFSGTEPLICGHRVERYDYDDNGSNWDTQTQGTDAVPFEVEHGGAVVAVDPGEAEQLL